MTYNGYANEDSYYFDMVWSNDRGIYDAIRKEGKHLLSVVPGMTDQTLGLNIKTMILATMNKGGWGYPGVPDEFKGVDFSNLTGSMTLDQMRNVNETEFGEKVRTALETEDDL